MVAIGSGAQASIESQICSAGSNLIVISSGSSGFGPVREGQGAIRGHPDTLDGGCSC